MKQEARYMTLKRLAATVRTMSLSNNLEKELCAQTLDKTCHDCSKYNFKVALAALDSGDYPRDGIMIANVGKRYRTPFETNCSLCRILLACRKSSLNLYLINNEDEADTDELRAFLLSASSLNPNHRLNYGRDVIVGKNTIYIDLVSSKSPIGFTKQLTQNEDGFAVIHRPHELLFAFTTQIVPSFFDPAVAKTWIQHCESEHKAICSPQRTLPVENLALIDCRSLTVEQGHRDAPYIALSYVWGSSAARDKYALEVASDGKILLPSLLPRVILDAMTVTKSLGFRYLWVDKYCIDQANKKLQHQQIRQMDSIYENAVLTIIAAAGFDETYGLPGVGSKSRSIQPIVHMEDLIILSTVRDIHHSIRSSKWSTRGWTFQEAVLSRRRLVFTDEQMYFECGKMNCCESMSGAFGVSGDKHRFIFDHSLRAGMFERHSWHNFINFGNPGDTWDIFTRYLTAIEEYTCRELRYQHDSLNAFVGLIKKYEEAHDPIIQLWGIPTTIKRREWTERFFTHALCWSHEYSCWDGHLRPCRRPDFPSWSWAGWAGKVNYPKQRNPIGKPSLIVWSEIVSISLESEAGRILELGKISELIPIFHFDMPFTKIFRLEARVFPPYTFSYNWMGIWEAFGSPAVVSLSQGPVSEARLHQQLNEADSGVQCIYMGMADTSIFGLILETRGGVSSRVGFVIVEKKSLHYGYIEFSADFEQRTFRIL
ncbi:hypothetical protein ACSS6W_006459 [Trichoderma asperelloides]